MPKIDAGPTLRSFDSAEKNIRFGIARGLTWTARQARDDLKARAATTFDRPTRWTLNGFYFLPATREKLAAVVEAKDEFGAGGQYATATVLKPHIYGGSRKRKRSEVKLGLKGLMGNKGYYVPARGVKLDRYGNIPGSVIGSILSDLQAAESEAGYQANRTARSTKRNKRYKNVRYFVPKAGSRLPPGVWQRKGRQIEPVLIFVPTVQYRKIFPFFETIADSVKKNVAANIRKSVAQAIATKR